MTSSGLTILAVLGAHSKGLAVERGDVGEDMGMNLDVSSDEKVLLQMEVDVAPCNSTGEFGREAGQFLPRGYITVTLPKNCHPLAQKVTFLPFFALSKTASMILSTSLASLALTGISSSFPLTSAFPNAE